MKTLRELRNKISFDKNIDTESNSSNSGSSANIKRSSLNFKNNGESCSNIDLYNGQFYSNIKNIDWNNISNIEKVDYGNSNIFLLISFNNKKCNNIDNNNSCCDEQLQPSTNQILIKSSNTTAQDVYAHFLENILKYPIPDIRLLEFSNPEYIEMSSNLLNFTKNDQILNEFLKIELEKSFILLLEYRIGGKRFNELNHKEFFSGSKGNKKYKQLGKIIAFDIFSNNFCRLPSSWNQSTFFSNILCYDTPDKNGWYFSKMSNINFLNNSPFTIGYRDYMNRLKLLLFSIFQNPSSESVQIKLMRDHLLKTQGIKLPSSSVIYLQKGIASGIKCIACSINYTVLENTKEKVRNIIKTDNNNIWKRGIDSIYCPSLIDILNEIIIEFTNYREKTYFVK